MLPAPPPFRLGAVVLSHGWFQTPPFAWDPAVEELTRLEALAGGLTRVAVRGAEGGVEVRADRRLGAADAAEALARVRRVCQLDHDVSGLVGAAQMVDPALARDLDALGAGRMLAGASLWEDLAKALCSTNIRWPQAVTCITRLAELGADGAFPEPEAVIAAGEDALRARARVGYRAPHLVAAARAALEGEVAALDREATALEGPALIERLRRFAGIGPATARFLAMLLGRYDVPGVDSAVIRHAAAGWFGGRVPTPAEVTARVEGAQPYAGLVLAWFVMISWQREEGLIPSPPPAGGDPGTGRGPAPRPRGPGTAGPPPTR